MKNSKIGDFFAIFGRTEGKKNNFKTQTCFYLLNNNITKFHQIWEQQKTPAVNGFTDWVLNLLFIIL